MSSLRLAVFDFDLTLSAFHVFNSLAGFVRQDVAVLPVAAPHAQTEQGQLCRLLELEGFALAAFGGRERVLMLQYLFDTLDSAGVECVCCTWGMVGPVRWCLEQVGLLKYFSEIFGVIGSTYGSSWYDLQVSAAALGPDSRLLGSHIHAGWNSKQQLVARCMSFRGLQSNNTVYLDDDAKEVNSMRRICKTIWVHQARGITKNELELLFAMISRSSGLHRERSPNGVQRQQQAGVQGAVSHSGPFLLVRTGFPNSCLMQDGSAICGPSRNSSTHAHVVGSSLASVGPASNSNKSPTAGFAFTEADVRHIPSTGSSCESSPNCIKSGLAQYTRKPATRQMAARSFSCRHAPCAVTATECDLPDLGSPRAISAPSSPRVTTPPPSSKSPRRVGSMSATVKRPNSATTPGAHRCCHGQSQAAPTGDDGLVGRSISARDSGRKNKRSSSRRQQSPKHHGETDPSSRLDTSSECRRREQRTFVRHPASTRVLVNNLQDDTVVTETVAVDRSRVMKPVGEVACEATSNSITRSTLGESFQTREMISEPATFELFNMSASRRSCTEKISKLHNDVQQLWNKFGDPQLRSELSKQGTDAPQPQRSGLSVEVSDPADTPRKLAQRSSMLKAKLLDLENTTGKLDHLLKTFKENRRPGFISVEC